ncbi:MAG: flagellar hook-length control protein FliK [Planctomycetaceae bacterium]
MTPVNVVTPVAMVTASPKSTKDSDDTKPVSSATAPETSQNPAALHAALTAVSSGEVSTGLATAPSAANTAPESLSTIGPADIPVHDQVHAAVLRAGTLDQQLTIVLRPPELGRVQIDVVRQDGQMSARLQTETATAHRLLSEHLPQLHETFAQMGLNADQVQVVRYDPPQTSGAIGENTTDGWSDQQAGQSSQHQQQETGTPDPQWIEEPEAADAPARNIWSRTALNLRV